MTIEQLDSIDVQWLLRKIPIDRIEDAANKQELPWRTYDSIRQTWYRLQNQAIRLEWANAEG